MANIEHIENKELGSSVRGKINSIIDRMNLVNTNLPALNLPGISSLTSGGLGSLDFVDTSILQPDQMVFLPDLPSLVATEAGLSVTPKHWILRTSASRPAEAVNIVWADDSAELYWESSWAGNPGVSDSSRFVPFPAAADSAGTVGDMSVGEIANVEWLAVYIGDGTTHLWGFTPTSTAYPTA